MKTKPSRKLTFRDLLSQLTFEQACRCLGPRGNKLIVAGGRQSFDLPGQVFLGHDLLRLRFDEVDERNMPIVATITTRRDARHRLHWNCSACSSACEHVGAAFALVLEEKTSLGLAEPPPDPAAPLESLPESELVHRALTERLERAKAERMRVRSQDTSQPWTDYLVTSAASGKSYRVALRGRELGQSYCSCPDFRTNTLGTCKHVMKVLSLAERRFDAKTLAKPYAVQRLSVYLKYGVEISLELEVPKKLPPLVAQRVEDWSSSTKHSANDWFKFLAELEALGSPAHVYPDAEEYLDRNLRHARLSRIAAQIRHDPKKHPLRETLLKAPLLPYQLDGIAFAAGAGRAVLADDMGLGKTIQGVGVAELLAREAGIRKVLVICPASLKAQWAAEIRRFSDRDAQLITGSATARGEQYGNDCFFTICNYEQVIKDILAIERQTWDLIILDEGQRIKNWEAKTSRVIKGLKSMFALVLSGTPLENRLEELYSVVQFIDDRRLGPGFRFLNRHRMADEDGRVRGYRNLEQLRANLREVLLRRTRESVRLDLPSRNLEYVLLPVTDEQLELHHANLRVVRAIIKKPFISEMDLLRLRQALLNCRMSADSSCLVHKDGPTYSNKLAHLDEFVPRLFEEPNRKAIVFSEWTTMLDRIEPLLQRHKLPFVRLDGSVPQRQRQQLVHEFQTNPSCKLFLTTNAGSTGLNLQAANTVINVDLPWNPAVLDQRIARAHRMGQTQPVQVFALISEGTIEQNLLVTLAAKRDLAAAALDPETDIDQVNLPSGMQELKQRLERLLGARPEAAVDQSRRVEEQQVLASASTPAAPPEQRERVAAAGGELLGAAFRFLGELVAAQTPSGPAPAAMVSELRKGLEQCVDTDHAGRPRLTVTLPDRSALEGLASTLAQLLLAGKTP